MELLSPAGNVEKLYYAYAYGADAAYIGLKKFSLRVKADNFYEDEYKKVQALKEQFPGRRLHCALNISFHDEEIDALKANLDYFRQYPIDAFIVQDIGIVPLLQKEFPNAQLHLSTQASCVNSEAVKMYKSLGFSRIVLGREISLEQIRRIKDAVPDMELETFVHGAMCIAYAGRCLMSAYLTGRSAQSGFCSHTCRWNFKLDEDRAGANDSATAHIITAQEAKELAQSGLLTLEEQQRPGEKFPVFEGEDFTAVLSSKDLRMIEHLSDLRDAGVDSLKIEGRMKSVYYVAMVTRAYRKALDALDGKLTAEEAAPYIAELDNVAHRESTTGFYYNKADADKTTSGASDSKYQLAAEIGGELTSSAFDSLYAEGHARYEASQKELETMHPQAREARLKDFEIHPDRRIETFEKKEGWHMYECKGMNMIRTGENIEFVSPDFCSLTLTPDEWQIIDSETGLKINWTCDGHPTAIYVNHVLPQGTLLRTLDPDYVEGKIRDSGR